jgi:cytochrome P450 family 4
MSFFLHCIAKYPEHQVKPLKDTSIHLKLELYYSDCVNTFRLRFVKQLVLQEVDAVFGDSDRDCSVQDAAELKYLECCIKETLRLYPSVPAIMRCLTEDIEIGQSSLTMHAI